MLITLPSGMTGEIRGMKGREAQALADPTLTRSGKSVEIMLEACFLSVVEPGVYSFEPGSKPKWTNVFLADRFQALIDIRIATWGAEYEFALQCGECRERYDWELDLRELPRKLMPEETRAQLKEGHNRFTCEGPDDSEITFKLANGADEATIAKLRRQNKGRWGIVDALAVQVVNVSSIMPRDAQQDRPSQKAIRGWLEELDLLPLRAVLDAIQAHDGGVETDIETECPLCQWRQEVALPFDGTFFYPKKKKATTTETTNA